MRSRRLAGWLVLATIPGLVLSAAAVAAPARHTAKASKPPQSGRWKLDGSDYSQDSLRGSFTVTAKHRTVKAITITAGTGELENCGTGTTKVIGPQTILHLTGTTTFGPYNRWIVGKRTPHGSSPFGPKKVTISHGGKRRPGTLELEFHGPRGGAKTTFGEVSYGQCQFTFGIVKG
jgi:hypothetical protein